MELDLEGQLAERAYPILASLVVPRPIALVTTVSPEGKVNAAPFSFFNLLGADPPILAVAPGVRDDGTPKDTARNIRLTHEFVVNLVDEGLAEAMNKCAASLAYGEDELRHELRHLSAWKKTSLGIATRLMPGPDQSTVRAMLSVHL